MPQKHHYIPVFYLKRWVGDDGRLCVYSRWRARVEAKRMHPDATGYWKDLYAITGAGDETKNHLEGRFFSRADSSAAKVLTLFETGGELPDAETRTAWSRFVMTLLHRNPEAISKWVSNAQRVAAEVADDFRKNYASRRLPTDPEKFEDYPLKSQDYYVAKSAVLTLQALIDSEPLGNHLNRMAWVITPLRSSYSLLTSDRPLVMPNGLSNPASFLAMPIGPRRLFIAANDLAPAERLAQQDHDGLAAMINDAVAGQARRFVWGVDDRQLRFVERRLGEMRAMHAAEVTEC